MPLPPFLARLLGDRSAVLPSPPTSTVDTIRETRFADKLASSVSRSSPYLPALVPRDFPTVLWRVHPGMPPTARIRGIRGVARDTLPNATVRPLPGGDVALTAKSQSIASVTPMGNVRKVVRR